MTGSGVVIIVGGSGLIGSKLMDTLSGFSLLNADLSDKFPGRYFFSFDITNEASIRNLIDYAHNRFGRIIGVVNCSYPRAANYGADLKNVTQKSFSENVSIHLTSYFMLAKLFSEYFESNGGGNLIQFSSIYGVRAPRFEIYPVGMTMPVEYAVIKSGILHMNSYFAKYFKGKKIRFNCISPGGVLNGHTDEFQNSYAEHTLNQGMLDVGDLTGAVQFLLSDASKLINGQNLIVDDGWTL